MKIRELLVGRRIVSAEIGEWDIKADQWGPRATGRLILDDGTEVFVIPNIGGCSCSAGDYELKKLATVDNAISDVQLLVDPLDGDGMWEDGQTYRIHVVADAIDMDVATIEGDDGNGYYGTGYNLVVSEPRFKKRAK